MLPLSPITKDLSWTKPAIDIGSVYSVSGTSVIKTDWANPAVFLPGSKSGFRNPDWRNKVQQKKDATTPLELRVDDMKYVNIHDTVKYKYTINATNYGGGEGSLLVRPEKTDQESEFPTTIDTTWSCYKEARNIALTYRSKYVAENTQPFQSQVFLGEIKETLDFIRHPFGKLRALANSGKVAAYNASLKSYREAAIKHRGGVFSRTSEARLLLNDVADAWFEVRFALLPLVQDVTSAISVVSGRKSTKRSSFRGDSLQTLSPLSTSWTCLGLPGTRIITRQLKCSYFVNTGLLFDDSTNYEGFTDYLQSTTLELTNFIPTVWELTPGSWLVDYFVNVGDILNSIASSSKVSMTYDCRTAVVEYTKRYNFVIDPTVISDRRYKFDSYGTSAYMERSRKYVSRTIGTDVFPSVVFSLPSGMPQLANTAFYLSRKFSNIFR